MLFIIGGGWIQEQILKMLLNNRVSVCSAHEGDLLRSPIDKWPEFSAGMVEKLKGYKTRIGHRVESTLQRMRRWITIHFCAISPSFPFFFLSSFLLTNILSLV